MSTRSAASCCCARSAAASYCSCAAVDTASVLGMEDAKLSASERAWAREDCSRPSIFSEVVGSYNEGGNIAVYVNN